MTLVRAYYYCKVCGKGFCPRDNELGLHNTSLSVGIMRMVGLTAATVSFAESSELMSELAGVSIGAKQIERVAEDLGRDISDDERNTIQSEHCNASTMYLGMDGTGIPMRASELRERQGKQADGSAKTREVKLVTVWSAEGRNKEGLPTRDPGSITYSAAIESAAVKDTDNTNSVFAQRVVRESQRRNFGDAHRQVILGDGALWIWNLADEEFPGAIQIVDLFHAKEHLSEVSKVIFGSKSDLGQQWAKQRYEELENDNMDDLLEALETHAKAYSEVQNCLNYFTRNRHRMTYAKFRAQGLCVGSGVVEAGCKLTIGTRLKRSGMHWTLKGANAIIALRCCKLSGRFDNFWERRSGKSIAA